MAPRWITLGGMTHPRALNAAPLFDAFVDATRYLSGNAHRHPSAAPLLDLGEAALPALFRRFQKDPSWHLIELADAITGHGGPEIPEAHQGQAKPVFAAWLAWAQEKGFLP